ncbi:Aldehyde/histidinol dehydrogenase [Dichotomocladium elegans]|nr:Aldehyde/histidinol dehydrogenase [Dichotomocladium elegans]
MATPRFSVAVPETLQFTSFDSIEDSVSVVRGSFIAGKPRNMFWRKFQLNRLYSMVKDHEEKFYEALAKDLGKPRHEALMGDISPLLEECLYFIDNLDRLSKDETVAAHSLVNRADTCIIRKDPLGVVLIIGCWNYPLQLGLVPLAGAIAAGNAAVIKLSEISMHTAALITELFPKYMDTSCYRIVNGGPQEATALLGYHFDHIFYTGGGPVAKNVMAAAAKHLTPVTLELGGKSPAIVTEDANLKVVASRIVFGKFFNTGQSCVAVDYVLVPRSHMHALVEALKETIEDRFGQNPKATEDYGRIVSHRHFDRLAGLLELRSSGNIVMGGSLDRESRYIAPTVIADVSFEDPGMMEEEIFGPILPIVPYNALEDAISVVRRHPPPLALYIFANKKKDQSKRNDRGNSFWRCMHQRCTGSFC